MNPARETTKQRLGPLLLGLAALTAASAARATAFPVDLGTAGHYAVLAKTGITNVGDTSIRGNVGVYPVNASSIGGFDLSVNGTQDHATSPLVQGRVYAADYPFPTPNKLLTAIADMQCAYLSATAEATDTTELDNGLIGGSTLAPGVYKWDGNVLVSSDVSLSGSATALWVFQINGNLTVGSGVQVKLVNGGDPKNVVWAVEGVTELAGDAVLNGTILGLAGIILENDATLNGKALSQSDVTLISDTIH